MRLQHLGLAIALLTSTLSLPAQERKAPDVSTAAAASLPGLGLRNIIQSVSVVQGQLVATTTQGQQLPIQLSTIATEGLNPCPVLQLSLGPIDLNLLGLLIQTSPICLDITAQPGPGNLLGNLLCAIARLLDRGVTLSQILGAAPDQTVAFLTTSLKAVLNGALDSLNEATVTSSSPDGLGCTILTLALGPLHLNLLGLLVDLDNCAGGPVMLEITARPGLGALLGNLLCNLLGGVPPGTTLQAVLLAILNALFGTI